MSADEFHVVQVFLINDDSGWIVKSDHIKRMIGRQDDGFDVISCHMSTPTLISCINNFISVNKY